MLPWATMQALSFSSFPDAVCFALKTSLTGLKQFAEAKCSQVEMEFHAQGIQNWDHYVIRC
jgi:hypothetical protein